jgi:hypothetical protein
LLDPSIIKDPRRFVFVAWLTVDVTAGVPLMLTVGVPLIVTVAIFTLVLLTLGAPEIVTLGVLATLTFRFAPLTLVTARVDPLTEKFPVPAFAVTVGVPEIETAGVPLIDTLGVPLMVTVPTLTAVAFVAIEAAIETGWVT